MSNDQGGAVDSGSGAQPPEATRIDLAALPEGQLPAWLSVYGAVASRRTAFDTMLWQTPSLGLAAQAFLFTIALSPASSTVGRIVAAGLSLVTSLVAIQTMTKHRYNEVTDARLLSALEDRLGVHICGTSPHRPPKERGEAVDNAEAFLNRMKTFDLWRISLSAFALASLGVILVSVTSPEILRGP